MKVIEALVSHRQRADWLGSAGGVVLTVSLLLGCDDGSSHRVQDSNPRPGGPLMVARWPSNEVHSRMLLHDDGGSLWAVPLAGGKPRLLWKHPRVRIYEIVAGPDGDSLAYSVSADPPPRSPKESSFFLYLLKHSGRVELVDQVQNFGSIESPRFLRTAEDGFVTLYWIRSHQNVSVETGRLAKEVKMLDHDGESKTVRVPLRYGEAADQISGYAGSPMFTLATFLRDDLPVRLQILRSTVAEGDFWREFGPVASTDVFTGVAWTSPREYVVPVGHRSYKHRFSLRVFRVSCEYAGSHVAYRGPAIDWGYSEALWPMLPAGPRHVLVLGATALEKVRNGSAQSAPWLRVNVRSGGIKRTKARWTPGGWWTFVQPRSRQGFPKSRREAACGKYSWSYP